MTRPQWEVADIVRRHGAAFVATSRAWLTGHHQSVLRAIAQCRTAALGGHRDRCDTCAHPHLSYNSCRNRHCPKCLTAARDVWLAARQRELLPVGYVHVVVTLPHTLGALALANKRVVYDLLFHATAATLLQVAANPKRLGATIGGLMVLHTWGQQLLHHPHVHCVVPAGGLSPDGTRWIHAPPRFFLPVKVLATVFRGKFVAGLREAWAAGRLHLPGDLQRLEQAAAWRAFLRSLHRQRWVVYAKPPFESAGHVLHYLARYTHRVAIANQRLVDVTDETVSFRWKDYRHGSAVKIATVSIEDFLHRFLLHVLPKRFVRIRYVGLLAARCRTAALAQCRRALAVTPDPPAVADPTPTRVAWPCPRCGGPMRIVERFTARQLALRALLEGLGVDTS